MPIIVLKVQGHHTVTTPVIIGRLFLVCLAAAWLVCHGGPCHAMGSLVCGSDQRSSESCGGHSSPLGAWESDLPDGTPHSHGETQDRSQGTDGPSSKSQDSERPHFAHHHCGLVWGLLPSRCETVECSLVTAVSEIVFGDPRTELPEGQTGIDLPPKV